MVAACVSIQIFLSCICGSSQPSIISVQTGEHPEFIRLSLSWPLPVNFDYIRTPNSFEVRFFRKAELLLDRLTSIFPGSSYKHEGDQTILMIRTPTNRNFVAKSYGNITYLDIYKEGANEPNFIPHPALKTSQPIAENKQDIKKTTEVDLQNLFRKVADYLGELKPDIQSTVVSFGESRLLLKYLNDPIAIYEYEQKVYIVVLKDEYPMLEKQLEEKYAIRLIKLKGAFALQLTPKLLTRAIVAKHKEGWQIEFGSFMPNGKSPQFFTRDGDTKIKLNREGVLDPIDVEGVLVFCTLSPDVFAPLEFSHRAVSVLATSAGAAFKVDLPEEVTFDRDFITLSFEGGVLPQEKPRKLRFDLLNLSEPFLTSKQKLVESIVSSEDTDVQKRIDLIHLYLSQTFASEALSEIKALEKVNSDKDKSLVWWVLSGVASILEGGQDAEVLSTLFSLSNSDLEASAWYGFLMARIEQYKLPPYLEDFLANTIVGLPEPLRSLLLLSLADSLLSQGSTDSAEVVLRHINDS